MKRAAIISVLLFAVFSQAIAQSTPREWFGDLFVAVQMQPVFPDQKTFVDCIPKEDPQKILNEYESEKNDSAFDLKKFVSSHFNLPNNTSSNYSSNISAGVVAHINELWDVLSRHPDTIHNEYSSLLPLPYSYVVPGGRFREVYYWDSYFTMLGLKESGDTAMIEDMIKNFSYLIMQYGFIPNGNRTYYLSRSQPPFFSLMIDLLAELKGTRRIPGISSFIIERIWILDEGKK